MPYSFLTYMPRLPSRHTYLASVGLAFIVAAGPPGSSQHPEIVTISRDRCGLYAEGATLGAPQSQQVADRFHLLVNLSATRVRHILTPMLGLAPSYYPSRHFRLEAAASGFGLPHRYGIWNADASLNVRVTGHIELRVGAKAFYFKTSPRDEYYLRGLMAGAFFGLRWYSNSE